MFGCCARRGSKRNNRPARDVGRRIAPPYTSAHGRHARLPPAQAPVFNSCFVFVSRMRASARLPCIMSGSCRPESLRPSVFPARGVGDEEVAEDLDARDVLHFLRIDEVALWFRHVGAGQQLHQPALRIEQIFGQHRDADASIDRLAQGRDIVDRQGRDARFFMSRPAVSSELRLLRKLAPVTP